MSFREQVADCGLLKPVTVSDEVYQATANDAKALGAVDSLVRRISMLQAAIRHLLGLLATAVERSGQGACARIAYCVCARVRIVCVRACMPA